MDVLRGNFLMNWLEELVIANELMRSYQYLGLYFSASWCPPCQSFLPLLKDMFAKAQDRKLSFQIIFVSSDKDDQTMRQFFIEKHGSWYAVPVGRLTVALRKKMRIQAIPEFVVTSSKGQMISKTGKRDIEVMEDPLSVWIPPEEPEDEEEIDQEDDDEDGSGKS